MEKEYNAKGYLCFCLTEHGLDYTIDEKEDILIQNDDIFSSFTKKIYDIMNGERFFEYVDSGAIINNDGTLSEVFVDGYISNLGLCHKGLRQGHFLVDAHTWLSLCKSHKIEVNWANK